MENGAAAQQNADGQQTLAEKQARAIGRRSGLATIPATERLGDAHPQGTVSQVSEAATNNMYEQWQRFRAWHPPLWHETDEPKPSICEPKPLISTDCEPKPQISSTRSARAGVPFLLLSSFVLLFFPQPRY